ncbi:helicase, partial [Streptomyces sp. NPDC048142]
NRRSQDAMWGEGEAMVPIGQHMANLRRKGGLGKDPKRAAERAAQLAAIDEDWNCPWPLNWQRHYRILADLVDADGQLAALAKLGMDWAKPVPALLCTPTGHGPTNRPPPELAQALVQPPLA